MGKEIAMQLTPEVLKDVYLANVNPCMRMIDNKERFLHGHWKFRNLFLFFSGNVFAMHSFKPYIKRRATLGLSVSPETTL